MNKAGAVKGSILGRDCWGSFVAAACLFLTSFGALADGTVTLLHTFVPRSPAGAFPWSTLTQGADGNFYGVAGSGGAFGAGTIFRVTASGDLTPLYAFTNGIDGGYPRAGLLLSSNGSFYGTAAYGGSNGVGTVFKLTTSGVFTPLYSFRTNGIDGQRPQAALVEGADGNFYGSTYYGGSNGAGTVYRITPDGAMTNLHTFTRLGADGAQPCAPLIPGPDGNFYGTTAYGGTRSYGTVFMMTPEGAWTNLHSFTYGIDGGIPWAGLVLGTDGNFYGTTYSGGAYGYGTVFVITPDGTLTTLYSFDNGVDGGFPYAALVQGANGNFYGTTHGSSTFGHGTNSIGTIFEITPWGSLTTWYSFTNGIDGANPTAGLVLGTNGDFFGAAKAGGVIGWGGPFGSYGRILGGTLGWGTIFSLSAGGDFRPLCVFPSSREGANPGAGLIQAADGALYGVAERGGTNDDGTLFRMSWDGTVTPLYSFTAGADGAVPAAALTQGQDGNFYGTTYGGGPNGAGSVFSITPGGAFTVLHTFTNGSDGGCPLAAMVQGSDGNFYGTTTSGGTKNGYGTVFQMTAAGALTTLHAFTNGSDGGSPIGLVPGAGGEFYGTAQQGGTNNQGTIFRISAAGVLNPVYLFKGGLDGSNPAGALTAGRDGGFYGVCAYGGATGNGTVFRVTTNGLLTPLYSFTGTNDGGHPQGPLSLGADGKLYGTTEYGGDNGYGTVFQITTNGFLRTLYSFAFLENGPASYAAIIQATNGNFYVACEGAGWGYPTGTILRLIVPPAFESITEAGTSSVISWSGETGQKYQLQHNRSLDPSGWTDQGLPITAASSLITATNSHPAGVQGFYRLLVLP